MSFESLLESFGGLKHASEHCKSLLDVMKDLLKAFWMCLEGLVQVLKKTRKRYSRLVVAGKRGN